VLHIVSAVQLTMRSPRRGRRGTPSGAAGEHARLEDDAVGRASVLLLFIVYHIGHFTTGTFHPAFSHTGVVRQRDHRLPVAVGRGVLRDAMAFARAAPLPRRVGGVPDARPAEASTANPLQRTLALWVAILVWAGFTVIPVAVLLGILN
jgi:hypothetical protein